MNPTTCISSSSSTNLQSPPPTYYYSLLCFALQFDFTRFEKMLSQQIIMEQMSLRKSMEKIQNQGIVEQKSKSSKINVIKSNNSKNTEKKQNTKKQSPHTSLSLKKNQTPSTNNPHTTSIPSKEKNSQQSQSINNKKKTAIPQIKSTPPSRVPKIDYIETASMPRFGMEDRQIRRLREKLQARMIYEWQQPQNRKSIRELRGNAI